MTSKEELEVALRIQKRMLAETRQKLSDVQADMDQKIKDVKGEMIAVIKANHKLASEIKTKLATMAKQDQMIETLQRRVSNVNAAYNALDHRASPVFQVPVKEAKPRGHTTLEDVYKLTGEI